MPTPGEVLYLPPLDGDYHDPNKSDRPHLLLSLTQEQNDVVTFAYGSTKATEAAFGASHVLVDPYATAYRGTGLSEPTYFYLSRLVGHANDDLPRSSGRIIDEMPAVRGALRSALGFGTGVTRKCTGEQSARANRAVHG